MFLITGVCTSPDSTWSPEHHLLECKIEIQEVKKREVSVFCQCYLGLLDGRVASASWSPFFEGSLQRRQDRKEGRGGREVHEGEGVGSGHPLGLNLAFWEVFSSPSFNYAVKYCTDGCLAFHFASSQIYNPSSVATNIPLMNIYCMPGRRCGDPAGSNGSLQEHLGGSGISYGTREKAQHIKWSKLSGMRLGRLCAQEIKQCWRQWPCILRPEVVFQLIWKWLSLFCSVKNTKYNFCLSPFHSTWACVLFHHWPHELPKSKGQERQAERGPGFLAENFPEGAFSRFGCSQGVPLRAMKQKFTMCLLEVTTC